MIKIRCKKHPRYKAMLPPKASCQACIEIYELVNSIRLNETEGLELVQNAPKKISE
jgi:hypothetical protein